MNFFFHQLGRSISVFFRTLRAFFSRKIVGLGSQLRRLTNFSRHATKAASSSLQGVMSAAQKPTSPSDYVETGRLYISKALIIRILLAIVALGLIIYFLAWPFILSHFLVARFVKTDKRVPDWSGRVIVYSDKKKTLPLYEGRLEDGVLQGEGKQYDDEGILIFEGQFKDGVHDGSGKEYVDGVLAYEGQFADGVYSGRGKRYDEGQLVYDGQYDEGLRAGSGTAYKDGRLLYDGQFQNDLYEGRGKLYRDGALYYDGDFHDGVPEGIGTAYYPSGKLAHQGQYMAGKPDGNGTAYDEDGNKVFTGVFADGQYGGEGTLYFPEGGQLVGEFKNGEPTGTVEWKKNGILYYQGEWSDGAPSGFGTFYNKAGKVIYAGSLRGGTLDGHSFVGASTDKLREALGEGSVRTEVANDCFWIVAEELGMTAFCTFQTEEAPSTVFQIYLTAPESGDWVSILPGAAHTLPVQWGENAEPSPVTIYYEERPDVRLVEGKYFGENAVVDNRRTTVLYSDESREQAVLVTWVQTDVSLKSLNLGGGSAKVDDVAGFMDALDKIDGPAGAGGGAAFGKTSPDAAFAEVQDVAGAASATDAMIGYWEQKERMLALQEMDERLGMLLEDARKAEAKGTGSAEAVEALEQQRLELTNQMESSLTAGKRMELQAESAGVKNMDAYALGDMLVDFDPSDLSTAELTLAAVAYAQALDSETDTAAVETAVKESLLDLTDTYSAVKLALANYQTAAENTQRAAGAYSTGLGTKESWYAAMDAQTLARMEMCSALAAFSRDANTLNQRTGGWVSRTFNWHNDVFGPLFEAELLPDEPEEEPEEPAEDPLEGEDPAALPPEDETDPEDQTDDDDDDEENIPPLG